MHPNAASARWIGRSLPPPRQSLAGSSLYLLLIEVPEPQRLGIAQRSRFRIEQSTNSDKCSHRLGPSQALLAHPIFSRPRNPCRKTRESMSQMQAAVRPSPLRPAGAPSPPTWSTRSTGRSACLRHLLSCGRTAGHRRTKAEQSAAQRPRHGLSPVSVTGFLITVCITSVAVRARASISLPGTLPRVGAR